MGTTSPGTDAIGLSLPSTEHSISRAFAFFAADTLLDDQLAIEARSFVHRRGQFACVVNFADPTDEPRFAGFTNTGYFSVAFDVLASLLRRLAPLRCAGRSRASRSAGRASRKSRFITSLSMPGS